MIKKFYSFLSRGLKHSEVRYRIYRILAIASLLVSIGGSVILFAAFMMRMQVLVVALSGILSMALAFYLFIKLWPKEEKNEVVDRRVLKVKTASRTKKGLPEMTPGEYRSQRMKAQQMIAKKAAPALAKAIQSILHQAREDEARR